MRTLSWVPVLLLFVCAWATFLVHSTLVLAYMLGVAIGCLVGWVIDLALARPNRISK